MRLVGHCVPFRVAAVAVLVCRLCAVRARMMGESSRGPGRVMWETGVGGVGGASHS